MISRVYDCLGVAPPINDCCGPLTAGLVTMISNYSNIIIGESLGVDSIAILSVLLPIVSFLTGSNCYVKPDCELSWEEPIIIYSLLVGKKGTKKSPILKTMVDPLTQINEMISEKEKMVDLLFLDGTVEGLTKQLMLNKGEILQVSNEAETFFSKLYSQKGNICNLKIDDNKHRTMYLNFHGGGKFKNITKTQGATEISNVSLHFIGCIHPVTMIKYLNKEEQNHDGLLERYFEKLII